MAIELLVQGIQQGVAHIPKSPRVFNFNPFAIMIIQIVIIASALLILWWMIRGHYKNKMFTKDDKPIDILNKRYAAGELNKQDYDQLRKDIGA